MSIRPRRSVLYMPGSNPRAIEKARTLPADAVILDLEDSVAPDAKGAAREQIRQAVVAGGLGAREAIVRIKALDTAWWIEDLGRVRHLVKPKETVGLRFARSLALHLRGREITAQERDGIDNGMQVNDRLAAAHLPMSS
jgi:HpcH/HpaI aldolase/citrate lyase family